jgi:hypothetical protein
MTPLELRLENYNGVTLNAGVTSVQVEVRRLADFLCLDVRFVRFAWPNGHSE